jgi:phosphohistidine phosphatase
MPPRRLLLIRHAKAADGAVDIDRELTGRGTRQAAAIGTWLTDAGLAPDRAFVSPARRAAQTWELASAEFAQRPPSSVEERIYDNTVEDLLAVLADAPDDVSTLAVVGHNPSIGQLAYDLEDGEGPSTARRDLEAGFPTGTVAVFTLTTPFRELGPGTATLTDFRTPRD